MIVLSLALSGALAGIPVKLDGKWYDGGPNALIEYDAPGNIFALVDTLSNCRRQGGGPPSFSFFTLSIATQTDLFSAAIGNSIAYSLTPQKHFVINSADGDLVCANPIASPFDTIFANGYE